MKTIKEFVAQLGGGKKVALAVNKSPSNVTFWSKQNSIPVNHWPKIIELAHANQIECTPEILMRMCLNSLKKDETI